jgi:hypothetical protein
MKAMLKTINVRNSIKLKILVARPLKIPISSPVPSRSFSEESSYSYISRSLKYNNVSIPCIDFNISYIKIHPEGNTG